MQTANTLQVSWVCGWNRGVVPLCKTLAAAAAVRMATEVWQVMKLYTKYCKVGQSTHGLILYRPSLGSVATWNAWARDRLCKTWSSQRQFLAVRCVAGCWGIDLLLLVDAAAIRITQSLGGKVRETT